MLSGAQADPDVERLLEGTAFLTALLRQKMDDDFPEIVHDLLQVVAPHYLQPLPSATIQAFRPKSTMRNSFKLPAGIYCASVPVDGISCLFRTCYPAEIHPLRVVDASWSQSPGRPASIKIAFELTGIPLSEWKPGVLRLYLADDFAKATDLYLLLRRHVNTIHFVPEGDGRACTLGRRSLRPVGFEPHERLIPYPSQAFPGFGVLQEYFILPQKFLFLDLVGWDQWQGRGSGSRFEVRFELDDPRAAPVRVSRDSFVLHATPAVNLFSHDADPVYLDHRKTHYPIRPAGSDSEHYQVFSVDDVKGFVQGTCEERTYKPFETFRPGVGSEPVYHVSRSASIINAGVDHAVSVAYAPDTGLPVPETLSIQMTCTNGLLPGRLKAGDISIHGKGCPEYVTFANILPPTPGVAPRIGQNLLWRLLSHLSINFNSLENVETLKNLLELYLLPESGDPAALAHRKRIEGILDVRATPEDRLVSGMVMRGRKVAVTIREDHFAGRGDAFLFGCMLDTFFGNYASINSFTSLMMKDRDKGSTSVWPPRTGNRTLI